MMALNSMNALCFAKTGYLRTSYASFTAVVRKERVYMLRHALVFTHVNATKTKMRTP